MNFETDGRITVPMEVKWQPAWLTWVGAVTTCLKALGCNVDTTDVAGRSGYAFVMTVHEELCPSGPTVFDWGTLMFGANLLGRTALCFQSADCHDEHSKNERTIGHCRTVYELARSEIEAGRPCVIWGAYIPEFAVVYGIEDDKYLVKSYREVLGEEQPPLAFDDLNAPGGPYVLAFPGVSGCADLGNVDELTLARGVRHLTGRSWHAKYSMGLKAYGAWIRALEDESIWENGESRFGNAYNAQCWWEAKHFAHHFTERVAERNEKLAKPLTLAAKAYEETAEAMARLAQLFPFPPGEQVLDGAVRAEAILALSAAEAAERKAVAALEEVV